MSMRHPVPQECIWFLCVFWSLTDGSWQAALHPPTSRKSSPRTTIYVCPRDTDDIPVVWCHWRGATQTTNTSSRWVGKQCNECRRLQSSLDCKRVKGFPGGSDGKRVCLQCGRPGFNPWAGKIPWRRKWQHTPVFLPRKSHGWRNLAGYSPWSHKESDMTEWLHFLSFLWTTRRSNQSILNEINLNIHWTDAEAEVPILWAPDMKSRLIGKDPDAGRRSG